jgi:IS4 transposase
VVDGTDLPASEKRILPLRGFRGAALPGQSLVVYDPDLGLVCDLLAVEDAHAHERALMMHLLDAVGPGQLWLADRGFSTRAILRAIASRSAFFLIREHASNPHPTEVGPRRCLGRVETGVVYEQVVEIPGDEDHPPLRLRRIELHLDTPTEDGQSVLRLLTNVRAKRLNGRTLATLYRSRWRIEGMFQKLESALESEVRSLGVPNGALLAFCVAVVTFNVLRMLEAAVQKAHPICAEHPVSTFHIAAEVRENYGGLKIAVPSEHWTAHQALSDKQLARMLIEIAKRVDVVAIRKDVRGPKTRTKKGYAPAKVARRHVATARVLAAGTVEYHTC